MLLPMMSLQELTLDYKRLRTMRTATGLSQAEAARRIGVSRQMLNQWEQGLFRPKDPADLARLLRLYGATLDDLTS